MTHHLAGFRYDPESGERQMMCVCGWRFASSDADEAARRWELHAGDLNAESRDQPDEE